MSGFRPKRTLIALPLNTTPPSTQAAPAAATEYPSTSRRFIFDFCGFRECRMVTRISSSWAAGTKVAMQWSLDQSTWFYFGGTASGTTPAATEYLDAGTNGTFKSPWIPLPPQVNGDCFLRGVTLDGDAVTLGATGHLSLQLR